MEIKQISKRIEWIDIAKGIGILLVVLGHLSVNGQVIRTIVYSFHMPLFFTISGFLYKQKDFASTLKGGFKKLIVPIIFFMNFDTVLTLILCRFGIFDPVGFKDVIKCFLLLGGTLKNSPIWFLLVLFLCNTFQYFSCKNKIVTVSVIIISFFVSLFSVYVGTGMCWYVAFFPCMFFFECGYIFRKYKSSNIVKNSGNFNFKTYYIIPIIIIWLLATYLNGVVDIVWIEYGRSFLLLTVTGLAGSYLLVRFSKFIEAFKFSNIFILFGKNSMFILLTHYYITKYIIPKMFNVINAQPYQHKWYVEILLCIFLAFCYFILFKILNSLKTYMKNRK